MDRICIDEWAGEINTLQASYNSTNSMSVFPLHVHDQSFEMMLFRRGNVHYYIGDKAYHLEPGDVTLIAPNTFHGVYVQDETLYTRYPVHFGTKLVSELFHGDMDQTDLVSCFYSNKIKLCHLTENEQKDFIRYSELIRTGLAEKGFGWEVQVRSALSLLLLLVNSASQNTTGERHSILSPMVKKTIRYIDAHLTEEMSVQSIADALGISRSRLMHVFKETTELSLWTYVLNKRIVRAKDLLSEGKSISEACYESGFQDYGHFIKVFGKTNKGMTPGQYLKAVRANERKPT